MSSRISRWNLSSLAIAASRASSRRAICSRWTRSVVRVNNTRQPFSTRAKPRAAARWLLPPPGGPNNSKLAPLFNQASPENGWRVLFTRTTDLVQRLQIARRELALEAAIAKLEKFHLLILDDIAYVTKDQAETSVLFELISARYERRSLLITANQPFGEWGKIFPDQAMTVAVVDRLVHHATIFEMNVESYRRRAALDRKRSGGPPPIHATTVANA